MIFDSEIISSVCAVSSSGKAFALWMLPDSGDIFIEISGSEKSSGPHFVFSPWLSNNKHQIGFLKQECFSDSTLPEPSISRDEYLIRVGNVVDCLSRDGGKAVVSRVVSEACDFSIRDILEIASDYFEANPGAFRCLFSDADGSVWMTATPELLLSYDSREGILETMALAGTQPYTDFPVWDIKNIEEHGFVVDYILDVLRSVGLEPERQVPRTLESAGICHLCTPISCDCRLAGKAIENILDALNPTPAVCGYPKEKAISLIGEAEIHRRCLYAGYVGVETGDENKYFVNLRTCRFTKNHYSVYVGGGITSKSVPEDEWNETCLKASCMLDILKRHGQKVSDRI